MSSLVSIIIPTYNRASLLKETLSSIQAQTYTHRECIIVDDGSTDNSMKLLKKIQEADDRFKIFQREAHLKKGGNTCRNIGLDKAEGKYIQFFDSDDIMKPAMIQSKVELLEAKRCAYVISKTANFEHPDVTTITDVHDRFYTFKEYPITHVNYVTQVINWLTPDFMGEATLFDTLRFNENLPSGQEYNLFCKLTLESNKGVVLDEFTTLRRMHTASMRAILDSDKERLKQERILLYTESYKELKKRKAPKKGLYKLLKNICLLHVKDQPSRQDLFFISSSLLYVGAYKMSLYYTVYQLGATYFSKGYALRKKLLTYLID